MEDKKEFVADELHTINNVEIFSAGTWNGEKYTEKDLDEMIRAYEEVGEKVRPFVKLGHDSDQGLLQRDGLPAAGWISNLRRKGEKLVADFVDVPQKIFQLIENKAYRKVSSEIFWNIKIGEKVYKRMLGAVALLGADTPGVMNLDDILALFDLNKENYESLRVYDYPQEPIKESNVEKEKEITQLVDELAKANKALEDLKAVSEERTKELEELKAFKTEADEKLAEVEAEKKEAELQAFIGELEKEELVTPAMKEFVSAYVGEDKKEYTIGETAHTKQSMLKEMLKLYKESLVNLEESSEDGDKGEQDKGARIEEYMNEHKVDYKTAYKAVHKGN